MKIIGYDNPLTIENKNKPIAKIMTITSKYQDKEVQTVLNDMIAVIEKHQVPVELSLVVLGNMVTNLLLSSVGKNQRIVLAQAFSEALLNSIKNKE